MCFHTNYSIYQLLWATANFSLWVPTDVRQNYHCGTSEMYEMYKICSVILSLELWSCAQNR